MLSKSILTFCILLFGTATAANAGEFKLSSPTIAPNSILTQNQVFDGFGCTGKNISPAIEWKNPPKGTKSFAITLFDPDAPTGSGFWHWVAYNIPANVNKLPEGAGGTTGSLLPPGTIQGRTDFGTRSFGGACPPDGDKPHRYIFTIHALKVAKIEAPDDASAALVGFMLNANRLGKASFTAKYSR
jgi:Raf kinase inhibitor-like YbhB/YbcL family protein